MDTLLKYINSDYSFADFLIAIAILSSIVVCANKFIKFINELFKKAYESKQHIEEQKEILHINTKEIKRLTENIENLTSRLENCYQDLDKKIDNQAEKIEKLEKDGKARDCAILRDRILGGMRYFSKTKHCDGIVHIGISEYENMEHLFQEYFECGGNGLIQSMYDNEFLKFIIDKE